MIFRHLVAYCEQTLHRDEAHLRYISESPKSRIMKSRYNYGDNDNRSRISRKLLPDLREYLQGA